MCSSSDEDFTYQTKQKLQDIVVETVDGLIFKSHLNDLIPIDHL